MRSRFSLLASLALLALSACAAPTGGAADAPKNVARLAAAVSDPARPASDVALDGQRRGPEILAFIDVKPGWKVGDLMQGAGYFTRLWVAAAGKTGHVYAWSPPEFVAAKKELYGDSLDLLVKEYPGQVSPLRMTFRDLLFPEPLDMAFTSQNYHDLHMAKLPADTAAKLNAAVFAALKPGGIYVVVDHVANAGDLKSPDSVHRGDPAVMRRELEAAGFVFDGESNALRNPADDHTRHVFDPSIRGHTDQVIYRFRKPR